MVVLCPNLTCKKRLRVNDALAGKRMSCPACKTVLVAPQPVFKPRAGLMPHVTSPEVGRPSEGSARSPDATGKMPPDPSRPTPPPPDKRPTGVTSGVRVAAGASGSEAKTAGIPVTQGGLGTFPIVMLTSCAKTFSPATFGLTLLCFFLPFVHVSCQGERVTTLKGINFVIGKKLSTADLKLPRGFQDPFASTGMKLPPELRNPSRGQDKVDPELWAVAAFLAAVGGLAVSFVKDKRGWIGGTIAGSAGVVMLLLLKMKIDNDLVREGQGLLQAQYALGYYLAVLVFLGAAALHGFFLLESKKQTRRGVVGPCPGLPPLDAGARRPSTVPPRLSAEVLAQPRAAARKHATRIAIALVIVACLVATGAAVFFVVLGPAEVRQGRKLISAGLYEEASGVLTRYVARKPLDNKARYLLAIARVNEYAVADTHGSGASLFRVGASLEEAKQNLSRVLAAQPGWKETTQSDLATAAARIPSGAIDALARTLTIARLRAELNLADKRELAGELIGQLASLGHEGARRILLNEEVVQQALEWDPSLGGRMVELAVGEASGSAQELRTILPTLERWANQRPAMAPQVASQLLIKAKSLHDAGRIAEAKAVLSKALEIDPDVATTQEHALLCIRLMDPDDVKLTRCQYFLKQWPQSPHLADVLTVMVKDAVIVSDRHGRWQQPKTQPYLDGGREAAKKLVQAFPRRERLDLDVYELAKRLADNKQLDEAIRLVSDLLASVPDSAIKLQIADAVAQWRQQAGKGTLSPEFDTLAQEVEHELKIMTVSAGGAARALRDTPDAVHVVQVADGCTLDMFNSEEKELLRRWVASGGILWVNNNVLSLFEIQHSNWPVSGECRAAAVARICPVLTGCRSVVVSKGTPAAHDLSCQGVIQLLTGGRAGQESCWWSLVPYGRGWVSDVKAVDVGKGDGARFWLNFRLFCLGRPIPGAPASRLSSPPPLSEIPETAKPQSPVQPAVATEVLSLAAPQPDRIADANGLEKALAGDATPRVLWVGLSRAALGTRNIERLQDWAKAGGVLWLETDAAESFGFSNIKRIPLQRSRDRAEVARIPHPVVEGLQGRLIGYEVSTDGGVISGFQQDIFSGRNNVMPLLVQLEPAQQGRRPAVIVHVFCALRPYGQGLVIFRPTKIDTTTEAGRRFLENLGSFGPGTMAPSLRGRSSDARLGAGARNPGPRAVR
jgi:tetratricopeptide (TPR) repeat protein